MHARPGSRTYEIKIAQGVIWRRHCDGSHEDILPRTTQVPNIVLPEFSVPFQVTTQSDQWDRVDSLLVQESITLMNNILCFLFLLVPQNSEVKVEATSLSFISILISNYKIYCCDFCLYDIWFH